MKYDWIDHFKDACDKRIQILKDHEKKYGRSTLTQNGIKHIEFEYENAKGIVELTKKDLTEDHFYRLCWALDRYMDDLSKKVRKSLGMK